MSYVALYRTYRPQTFNDVAGQKHIVKTLQNAIKLDKVAHAYLFCGPRGTGKTSLAKILSKTLNCSNVINNEPCNKCDVCIDINKSKVTDVIEIDAASNNGVDEIRELKDKVKFPPINKYKIYIIDEVHMLTTAAFNALLKTLEEPPKNTVFILATTEVHKIPATILSRCQRFDFLSITVNEVLERLKDITLKEDIKIEDEALLTIAEFCEGGLRDALSLLDQCVSFSTSNIITLDEVLNISGNINKDTLLNILINCMKSDVASTLKELNMLINNGKELSKIVNDLIYFLRDALLFKANSHDNNRQIFNSNLFKDFAKLINNKIIYKYLNILNDTQNNMKLSTQKRTFLELGLITMCEVILEDEFLLHEKISELEEKIALLEKTIEDISKDKPIFLEENINPYIEKPMIVDEDTVMFKNPPIDVIEPKVVEEITYINTNMIADILNNGNKSKKILIQERLGKMKLKYRTSLVEVLCLGQVVASSSNKAIIVLDNKTSCNKTMKSQNYTKLVELLNEDDILINDFYCLPKDIWDEILEDYLLKFKKTKGDVILKDINIPIISPVKSEKVIQEDSDFKELLELFDPKIIKIEEN